MHDERATDRTRRPERRDRARNRETLLEAAREVFATSGIHAPLDRIAKLAGVGPGTLYRHFPNRSALWESILAEPLQRYLSIIEEALTDEDAWEGFSKFLYGMCGLDAEPGGYIGLLNTHFDDASELRVIRARIQLGITRIFARARRAGVIREDIAPQDLFFVTLSNAQVIAATKTTAPNTWRRNIALYLDAFRADSPERLPAEPLTIGQLTASIEAARL